MLGRKTPDLSDIIFLATSAAMNAESFLAENDLALDSTDYSIDGLLNDIEEINRQCSILQHSSGEITPEEQAMLNDILLRSHIVTEKLAALEWHHKQYGIPLDPFWRETG